MKSPCGTRLLARFRSALKGEINAVKAIVPASNINLANSAIRRIFSCRSSSLNPKSPHSPCRTLSPSSTKVLQPVWYKRSSTACAKVDLPAPDKPVNHKMTDLWPFWASRLCRVTVAWCQIVLLLCFAIFGNAVLRIHYSHGWSGIKNYIKGIFFVAYENLSSVVSVIMIE